MRKYSSLTTLNSAQPYLRSTIRTWFLMLLLHYARNAASSLCKMNMSSLILKRAAVLSAKISKRTKVLKTCMEVSQILTTDEEESTQVSL